MNIEIPTIENLTIGDKIIVFSKIYHELRIDRFLNNTRRHEKFEFNSESIMRLLIYTRLMYPSSKRCSFIQKGRFFEKDDFRKRGCSKEKRKDPIVQMGLLMDIYGNRLKKRPKYGISSNASKQSIPIEHNLLVDTLINRDKLESIIIDCWV